MIRVAVIGRFDKDIENIDCYLVRKNLQKLLIQNGMIPIVLTPIASKRKVLSLLKTCDGIILPGGEKENFLDKLAISYAISKNLPILGICLGMQIMGIEKDKKKFLKNKVPHHKTNKTYAHKIKINKKSHLYKIIKKPTISVNSRHQDTILVDKKWKVSARSSDGVIEAIEISNHPFCIGVQWHPEDIPDKNTKKLIQSFKTACKNYRKSYNKSNRSERSKVENKNIIFVHDKNRQ